MYYFYEREVFITEFSSFHYGCIFILYYTLKSREAFNRANDILRHAFCSKFSEKYMKTTLVCDIAVVLRLYLSLHIQKTAVPLDWPF